MPSLSTTVTGSVALTAGEGRGVLFSGGWDWGAPMHNGYQMSGAGFPAARTNACDLS